MKVIFEKVFLENLKRIDNTIKLTKYVIGTTYNNYIVDPTFINNLFSGMYLYNDVRKTSEYPLYSIWDNNEKFLKINITIPEDEKENLVEPSSNYCFIYCYGLYPDRVERIAFIIVDPIVVNKQITEFNKLNLNISSNLIELFFPEYTEANIETVMDSDTNFLEGIGIDYGVNIFTEQNNEITTKKSYYKYIRNIKTAGISSSFLYNNIYGEKIHNSSVIKIITSILSFSILGRVTNLNKNGGYLNLLGTLECDIYRLTNDYNILKIKEGEKIDITSLPIIEIETDNTEIKFSVDQLNKRLVYPSNKSGKTLSTTIVLRITNLDPITNKTIELRSEKINLTQPN